MKKTIGKSSSSGSKTRNGWIEIEKRPQAWAKPKPKRCQMLKKVFWVCRSCVDRTVFHKPICFMFYVLHTYSKLAFYCGVTLINGFTSLSSSTNMLMIPYTIFFCWSFLLLASPEWIFWSVAQHIRTYNTQQSKAKWRVSVHRASFSHSKQFRVYVDTFVHLSDYIYFERTYIYHRPTTHFSITYTWKKTTYNSHRLSTTNTRTTYMRLQQKP